MQQVDVQLLPPAAERTTTRREIVTRSARALGGAVLLMSAPTALWIAPAAAQDRSVTLTASGSGAQLTAGPGSAVARSAVAEAAAARGAARVQAAAALASAQSDGPAIAQGAAAVAAADPAQGAIAQSAVAVANASNQAENRAPAAPAGRNAARAAAPQPTLMVRRMPASGGGSRAGSRRVRGGAKAAPGGRVAGGSRVRGGRGGQEQATRAPRTGVGIGQPSQLSALFAGASGAAGLVALMLRHGSIAGSVAAGRIGKWTGLVNRIA